MKLLNINNRAKIERRSGVTKNENSLLGRKLIH